MDMMSSGFENVLCAWEVKECSVFLFIFEECFNIESSGVVNSAVPFRYTNNLGFAKIIEKVGDPIPNIARPVTMTFLSLSPTERPIDFAFFKFHCFTNSKVRSSPVAYRRKYKNKKKVNHKKQLW
ncbi:hypothetical protein M0813_07338 [Anaeramoeba flamelloides]|uniref:Uncharacterized protein n=1 Tax=Anaeramoeba flamelloides TaxID=1746091 RepID=A0ABQ8XAR6_9EUKA|nr:hypothetical protein M0813_07338 [Anaeramoeba flamelloides]